MESRRTVSLCVSTETMIMLSVRQEPQRGRLSEPRRTMLRYRFGMLTRKAALGVGVAGCGESGVISIIGVAEAPGRGVLVGAGVLVGRPVGTDVGSARAPAAPGT
jgi:hypothetical protein